jgi:hypothetical protein
LKEEDKGTTEKKRKTLYITISPLLANIYLNVFDTLLAVKKVQERLGGKIGEIRR